MAKSLTESPPLAQTALAIQSVGARPAMLASHFSHKASWGIAPWVRNIMATFGTIKTSLHFLALEVTACQNSIAKAKFLRFSKSSRGL